MDDSTESPASEAPSRAGAVQVVATGPVSAADLAFGGFQAGMLGIICLLLWVGVDASWARRGFWSEENLFASLFYGSEAISAGLTSKTFSGLAVYLMLYSVLGAIFAAAAGTGLLPLRRLLASLVFSLAWFYFSFHLLWKSLIPLAYLLYAERPMLVGHLIYGAWLARYPTYLPGPRHASMAPPPPPLTPIAPPAADESAPMVEPPSEEPPSKVEPDSAVDRQSAVEPPAALQPPIGD